ncbi:MAG: SMC-Scp complex subunit ScpB [Propionibacteriaceae bacterium]|jgi:segregation and condensation protein B|nr:SMC-Scp complex subunit ScpB [Propionibacteriaceae bacterium]
MTTAEDQPASGEGSPPPADDPPAFGEGSPAPGEGQSAVGDEPSLADGRTEVDDRLPAALEALLLMATEPVAEAELAASLGVDEAAVGSALAGLARFYADTGRGFELRRLGGGWRYYTDPSLAEVVGRAVLAGQHGKLSQASLETLAVIAYLQPISRSRIAAVRGVNVDGVVRTLLARDLVAETGKDEATGAGLLTTTDYFLERMGLTGLEELPELAPNLPDAAELEAELSQVVAATVGVEDDPGDPAPPLDLEAAGAEAESTAVPAGEAAPFVGALPEVVADGLSPAAGPAPVWSGEPFPDTATGEPSWMAERAAPAEDLGDGRGTAEPVPETVAKTWGRDDG